MRLRPPTWNRPASWARPGWLRRLPSWAELQRLPISMMIACLLAALGAVQMTFLIGNGLYRTYSWHQETRAVKSEIVALQNNLRVLNEAKAHADDPQELQAQARCLGFVGKSETVVVAQDAPDGSSNNCDAVRMP